SVPASGIYTFFVESDDGSQLFAGDAGAACKLVPAEGRTVASIQSLSGARAGTNASAWVEFSGEVSFAGQTAVGIQLELKCPEGTIPATILDSGSLTVTELLHREIRGSGICEFSSGEERRIVRLIVPTSEQIQSFESPERMDLNVVLTSAEQVRQLK